MSLDMESITHHDHLDEVQRELSDCPGTTNIAIIKALI